MTRCEHDKCVLPRGHSAAHVYKTDPDPYAGYLAGMPVVWASAYEQVKQELASLTSQRI